MALNVVIMGNDALGLGVRSRGLFEGSVIGLFGKGGTACHVTQSLVRDSKLGIREWEAGSLITQPRRSGECCISRDKAAGADCHTLHIAVERM
jgi:hypothetical protein